ncbi:Kinesin-like protein KIF16B [Acropora cervicornis]|uniref:Kinesin-like protein KIF16B n=1 Tax=Acropora cervicornis TaxID=6130 RepID=A0AAD9PY16_ACRCE|nr:Kinesin-like protein KIF16B [Acropora cervicornis]
MASLKVAVRARPLNNRELELGAKCIIQMEDQKTTIFNTKLYGDAVMEGDKARDSKKEFFFDHSYWSVDPKDQHFITQEQVFSDLGQGVLDAAFEGYNACLFAYGQTSAGKTYTMMGTNGLFRYIEENTSLSSSFRTEVSYLEIYNEHVRDLLRPPKLKKLPQQNLKVREHPKEGPYSHGFYKYEQHKQSFTCYFHHQVYSGQVHRGYAHERATSSGAVGQRLKEGANINKSLVTLGIVISTLAENSINASTSAKRSSFRKKLFVPYRDSALTFLLKDSLGGNSKTVMVAAISPAECNYGETLSTLRYAHRAKSIINSPTDPNVKLIRELRSEIDRLKSIIRKTESGDEASLTDSAKAAKKLHENQARVEQLTKDWTEKWKEAQSIMQSLKATKLRRSIACDVIVLGKNDVFKFNYPTEAAKMREKRRSGLLVTESTESLSNFHISPVRGSHGDLSMRSDVSSPVTLDSGVEVDIPVGNEALEEIKLEIERALQAEINSKQKEIDDQKEHIRSLREIHEASSQRAKQELDRVRLRMDEKHEEAKVEIEKHVEELFHLKYGEDYSEVVASNEDIAKEKEEVARFFDEEWQKISQYETKLADIELSRRRVLVDVEIERTRQAELHAFERDRDLKEIEEEQVKLLEIRENLNVVKAKAEESWNRDKLTLESTIEKDLIELNEVERKIHILEEKREQFSTDRSTAEHSEGARNEELEHAEEATEGFDKIVEKRRVSDLGPKYSKAVALDLRQTKRGSLNFKSEISPSDSGRFDDILEGQLQNLHAVKVEKEKEIERNRITLGEEMTSVEYYGQQALQNEAKMTELEEKYNVVRQQHEEKIRACLANLKNKEEDDMEAVDQVKERYRELIWKEYREIESLLVETFETDVLLESDEVTDSSVIAEKRLEVLDIVDERLRRIGSENDDLFLEFVAHKARFEKEEDRVHEQQKRISEQMLDGVKEKEIALQRLSGQREKFHVERVRERRLINARIHRLSRVRSSSDLQNEETLEFFKEEARKLREAFEKVDESESRLQYERRERENIHLQLEEARAKLRISEEDRSDCLNKTDDYEIVEKPLVNKLHVKFRVLGNHAAAEVLKEASHALLASSLPEMFRSAPVSSPRQPSEDPSHGGWTFHSNQKDVTIARKREEGRTGIMHCFMGRGVIKAPPQTVWEAVKNPLSRYIYDSMLKKINIVEHVEEGLKIVSSGWIVEPVRIDGQDASLVWYITKVNLGASSLPWRLIDVLSKNQPLSIAHLRSYLTPP